MKELQQLEQTMNVKDIRKLFKDKLKNEKFIVDKSGVKTIELAGINYIADQEVIFGELNKAYAEKELKWYDSQSLNVYDMPKTPLIWRQVADNNGYIISNYGWMVYSDDNHNQYKHCLRALRENKDTRRAMMIYTRPEMQFQYNENGKSDFCCTNTVQVLIRDNKMHYIVNQRSCDAIFGYKNDIYFHNEILKRLLKDIEEDYPEVKTGFITHQVGSLHVYERHFKFINE